MKKLVCCDATIYDVAQTDDHGALGIDCVDRTDECIDAVAQHMLEMASRNKDLPGAFLYEWPGIGKLSWVSASLYDTTPRPYSAEAVEKLKRETWVKYESFGDPYSKPGQKTAFQIGPREGHSVWLLRPDKKVAVFRNMRNYGDTNSGWQLWPCSPESAV